MQAPDLTQLYRQGLTLQQAGRVAEAVAIYRQILAVKSDIPEVLFQLARCLSGTDPKGAEDAFRRALNGKPKEPAIWQGLHGLLKGPARVKLEKEAARASIPLGSEGDAKPILAALAKGQAEQAEAAALRLTKLAPAAFWPAYALGQVWLTMGKPATGPLEAAHSRDADHAGARLALARAYMATGRPLQAEALLTSPNLPPDTPLALARLYRDTARPKAAVDLLRRASGKGPRWPAELALSLAQVGHGAEALKTARSAIAQGAHPDLLRATAVAAEEAGDIKGAEAMLDAALAKAATSPRANSPCATSSIRRRVPAGRGASAACYRHRADLWRGVSRLYEWAQNHSRRPASSSP